MSVATRRSLGEGEINVRDVVTVTLAPGQQSESDLTVPAGATFIAWRWFKSCDDMIHFTSAIICNFFEESSNSNTGPTADD